MDVEENKVGLKKRLKLGEIRVDSDDDEPIRLLLKLKKRKSKKVKLGVNGEKVEGRNDVDFGGMEDTLASFRKKLKGPTKNDESKLVGVTDGGSDRLEKDEGLVDKLVVDVDEEVVDVKSDVKSRKLLKKKRERKGKKTEEYVSPVRSERDVVDVDGDDVRMADGGSCENKLDCLDVFSRSESKRKKVVKWSKSSLGEDEVIDSKVVDDQEEGKDEPSCSSEILNVSLSSFVKKAQRKKPRHSASGSKLKREAQLSKNDPCENPNDMSVDLQAAFQKSSVSDAKVYSDSQKLEDYVPDICQVRPVSPQNQPGKNQNLDDPPDEIPGDISVGCSKSSDCLVTKGVMRPDDNISINCLQTVADHSLSVLYSEKILEDKTGEFCGEEAMIEGKYSMETAEEFRDEMIEGKCLLEAAEEFRDDMIEGRCLLEAAEDFRDEMLEEKRLIEAPEGFHDVGLCKLSDVEVRDDCASDKDVEVRNEVGQFVSSDAHNIVIGVPCSTPTSELVKEIVKPEKREAVVKSDDGCKHVLNGPRFVDQDRGDDDPSPTENGNFLESNNVCNERASRKIKKHKDGDVFYEGDIDWEVLDHDQDLPNSHRVVDVDPSNLSKDKLTSSNTDPDLENAAAAAVWPVSVGLKAFAASPAKWRSCGPPKHHSPKSSKIRERELLFNYTGSISM